MSGKSSRGQAKPAGKAGWKDSFALYRNKGSTPQIALTVALVLAARRWRALVDEHLRPIGQSSARMEAMSAIMHSPQPSAQIEIAKRLRIEGPTLTRMIDTLSRDGLVDRRPDPTDRRTKHLYLTEQGYIDLEQIFAVIEPLRHRLLDGMSVEEMETMTRALRILLDKLDTGLPEPQGD